MTEAPLPAPANRSRYQRSCCPAGVSGRPWRLSFVLISPTIVRQRQPVRPSSSGKRNSLDSRSVGDFDTLVGMCGRFTLTHREAKLLAAELGVWVESMIGYPPPIQHRSHRPRTAHALRGSGDSAGEVGPHQLLDDGPRAGIQEHQRSCRDGAESSVVSRGICAKAVCCAG